MNKSKVWIVGLGGIVLISSIVGQYLLSHSQDISKDLPIKHEFGLARIKERADFRIYIPTYLPNLVILEDWHSYEGDNSYLLVSIVYKTQNSPDDDPVVVRIYQNKARRVDIEFLNTKTGEDKLFVYEEVLIGSTKSVLMTAKYDLPIKKTSYDPRFAPSLYLLRGDTFIKLQASNKNIFPVEELIKVAESLIPIQ